MKRSSATMAGMVIGVLAAACGQGDPVFPDDGAAAECGDWYPGTSADAGATYDIEVGETFPCLVWESVRVNHEDTYFNAGELYLEAKHGVTSTAAMVIALVGVNCAGCQELVGALAEHEAELSGAAFMVGAVRDDFVSETTLDQAEEVLVDQDGWPLAWMVTNDVEGHLSADEFEGVPWVFVVRLSDMEVVAGGAGVYTQNNVDELVAFVQSLGDGGAFQEEFR